MNVKVAGKTSERIGISKEKVNPSVRSVQPSGKTTLRERMVPLIRKPLAEECYEAMLILTGKDSLEDK